MKRKPVRKVRQSVSDRRIRFVIECRKALREWMEQLDREREEQANQTKKVKSE